MAANNYFGYGGTQYAAANAAYQQTQQAYGVPAATGATTAASYSTQRTAYDAAYQTSATPVTYAASAPTAPTYDYGYSARAAPAAVGVTYDSAKTYYQPSAPTAAAVGVTTGQVAVTVASSPDFQNWQQASFGARQTNNAAAVAAAAAANKATYSATYSTVPTTRQLTVPPITAKVQTTANPSPYVTQYTSQQPTSVAANYHYSNTAQLQNTAKAVSVGTIGQPPPKKSPSTSYLQKPAQPITSMVTNTNNITTQINSSVSGSYNATNASVNVHSQNNAIQASVYSSIPAAYSNTNVGNTMYNTSSTAIRPKPNQTNTSSNAAYSNPYDAALFNAAATMYMNQNPRAQTKTGNNYKPRPGLGSNSKFHKFRPPKPQQLHYCDACKISCAGPSAYHDHLQGQKHKKKVAKVKPEQVKGKSSCGSNLPVFVCELCDIECTAADAYAAHLRGAKHTKVVKLHTRLGKPIPPPDPKAAAAIAALNAQEEAKTKTSNAATSTVNFNTATNATATTNRTSVAPRINFVSASNSTAATSTVTSANNNETSEKSDDISEEEKKDNDMSLLDDRPAVGSEYIEEEKDASGKLISFNCKLCECKFSDPNAKEMHMKGRKHRLQFKRKVDPKLKVEMKPNNFKHKRNEKWKKQTDKQKDTKRKEFRKSDVTKHEQQRLMWEEEFRRYEDDLKDYLDWCRKSGVSSSSVGGGVPGLLPRDIRHPLMRASPRPLMLGPGARLPVSNQSPQPPMFLLGVQSLQSLPRKLETFEDKHVIARHKTIYPNDSELKNIQKIVGHIEKALKFVSDQMMTEAEDKIKTKVADKQASELNETNDIQIKTESSEDELKISEKEDARGAIRELTGVLRIGIIAKGLILTGDDVINLVMLCSGKPTMSLLTKVVSLLPEQLKEVAKDVEFVVCSKPADAAIIITNSPKEENEKKITVNVTLTSTVIREEIMAISEKCVKKETLDDTVAGDGNKVSKEISPDPPDVLSKTKCLEALAALRHAKWFQARAATVQSCLIIIRILRDLCRRVPTWTPFNSWAMELLCEKVLSSTNAVLSPGDGLRRVLESISAGILLPDGPGLLDPCEKDPVDAAAYLTSQQREDITASAQFALRLIAFRQIYKMLGMEQLPSVPKFRNKPSSNRKRRRENSAGGRNEEVDGKKDKKDAEDDNEDENEIEEEEKMETDKSVPK